VQDCAADNGGPGGFWGIDPDLLKLLKGGFQFFPQIAPFSEGSGEYDKLLN
jgi:hypothetical protein